VGFVAAIEDLIRKRRGREAAVSGVKNVNGASGRWRSWSASSDVTAARTGHQDHLTVFAYKGIISNYDFREIIVTTRSPNACRQINTEGTAANGTVT